MRDHDHSADEPTLAALHHLRNPWRGWEVADDGRAVRIQTSDGVVVRLTVLPAAPEPGFAVRRIAAGFEQGVVRPVALRGGFDIGFNDVVVLAGESWLVRLVRAADSDEAAADGALVTHGHAGDRPEAADARCATTDAVLVVSGRGLAWLARLGEAPDALEVSTDRGTVREFLTARGLKAP